MEKVNSTENQEIKERFVANHVYCNVYSFIDILQNLEIDIFEGIDSNNLSVEPWENIWYDSCPECGAEIDGECICNYCGKNCINNYNSEPKEIYEYWAVSKFLYNKLRDREQPVWDAGTCWVWGRCATGQAIILDDVISQICEELSLLI